MKIDIKWAAFAALVALAAGGQAMSYILGDTVQAAVPQVIDRTPEKIEALKDQLVTELMNCERGGYSEEDGLVRIDNNSKGTLKGDDILSYGLMQFKTKTAQGFLKQRDGRDYTALETKLVMLDEQKAKALAKYAIFDTRGGIFHWANCAEKHGLVARVEAIKSLMN